VGLLSGVVEVVVLLLAQEPKEVLAVEVQFMAELVAVVAVVTQ
jgi:hypothetical protein